MEDRPMNRESELVPKMHRDFARRVIRQAQVEQRRRRVRRGVGLGLGAVVAIALVAAALRPRVRLQTPGNPATFAIVDVDDNTLSLLDETNEMQGDDPAGYFFPDAETLTASASD
jgi:hypothetical protein